MRSAGCIHSFLLITCSLSPCFLFASSAGRLFAQKRLSSRATPRLVLFTYPQAIIDTGTFIALFEHHSTLAFILETRQSTYPTYPKMNNGPHDPRGPPPPHPPQPPQGFMQHNPRINPRSNPAIGGGGVLDPRMGPGALVPPPPPLLAPPRPLQPTANATDAITAVLASMTQQNVYDVISSMKALSATDPDRAINLLAANPQLSHALVQAMLMNNMVDPISLQKRSASAHLPPQPPAPAAPPMLAAPVPPTPPTFHQAAPTIPQPVLEQQQQLLQQVMALTPADIASLPEDQRINILQLRAQLMGTS